MKIYLSAFITTAVLIVTSGLTASAQDIATGEGTFRQTCGACHTVGRGRLVGPDLVNIHQRRSEDWILKFVKSSQAVIKSGDQYADSLFRVFNQVVMPDQVNLTDEQIKNIISYIQTKSTATTAVLPDANTEQFNQKTGKTADILFSKTDIFLLGAIFLLLLVILHLARINKILGDQIRDYYSSNRSFF